MSRVSSPGWVALALGVLLVGILVTGARAEEPKPAAASSAAAPVASSAPSAAPPAGPADGTTLAAAPTASPASPGEAEAPELPPEERDYLADIEALTRGGHRVSGSAEGAAAATYIERRLRASGFDAVQHLDMAVWHARTVRCELELEGRRVKLHPLRPNVVVNAVTPAGGTTAPLVYVGRGGPSDLGAQSLVGAIVALDYDSFDAWELAFAYGAVAVLFVGDGDEVPVQPRHLGIPVDRPRYYVSRQTLGELVPGRHYPNAHLVSELVWEQGRGRNLIVRVRGTDAAFSSERVEPEALLIAAHYDTYGAIPDLSPGARGAANVAALIEMAAAFRRAPPRRDTWFAFLDNEARAQQGVRELYATLSGPGDAHQRAVTELRDERAHVAAMREVLSREGLTFTPTSSRVVAGASVDTWLQATLRDEADFARDDVRQELEVARLAKQGGAQVEHATLDALAERAMAWDDVRRAMHQGRLATLVTSQRAAAVTDANPGSRAQRFASMFDELERRVLARFERRLGELEVAVASAEQRVALRSALGYDNGDAAPWVVLHVNVDLADRGPRWGVVAGDATPQLYPWRPPKPEADAPGYYGRVLNAVRDSLPKEPLPLLDPHTLDDPSLGTSFAPGPFVSSGAVAGAYGTYNVSLMTGFDARPRDGHPADTLAQLEWRPLRQQALEAGVVLRRLADSAELSLPAVFSAVARSKRPGWSGGQATGDYASQVVSGSMSEDRPASGALVALWPGHAGWKAQPWETLADATVLPAYDPVALEPVDANGRFRITSFREDLHTEVAVLGALFDERGAVQALSGSERLVQRLSDAVRVDLLYGSSGTWSHLRTHEAKADALKVLKASSDAQFRQNRVLSGQLEAHGFFFVARQLGDYDIKLFQPMGPVVLGDFGGRYRFGAGVAPERFQGGLSLGERTATDLFALNESRLATLRAHGVTSADLEYLHGRARRERERAEKGTTVSAREAAYARSASLSHRVYLPLRAVMDDLVHAIVVLLLLSIPFAFAMERLLVCATTIYGRIAGFTTIFLATFGLLYWMHPGFAIASTPIIVFLAFALVLLSALVIVIVVRKFKTELRAMQGQQIAAHDAGVSHAATMLAAANMGMSTMRRRPTRTLLTTVTVVMLTFTILLFASFSRTVGVRTVYEGPTDPHTAPTLLVRKLDYSAMPGGVLDMLRGEEGDGGLIAPNYWVVRKDATAPRLLLTDVSGHDPLVVDGVMGISPEEVRRWPELAAALSSGSPDATAAALAKGAVFLPPIARDALGLRPGADVLLGGRRLPVAGTTDGVALQRLRHLDQQSLLPVDFQDPTSIAFRPDAGGGSTEGDLLLSDGPDRDFVHLSGAQVVVASTDVVRSLGGTLHSLSIYTGRDVDVAERSRTLAQTVVMPVWVAGPEGAERVVLTVLTEVTGGLALLVPLLLGGLIVFGTLLGSISDREKEIYTFSALGLSPTHVGVLFLAEASVYAIVGGLGGQLLAQLVGLILTRLANAGVMQPVSINFSSSNALFAIGVVMVTVLVSAIYPALRAGRSANPGVARTWRMPPAEGSDIRLVFPFTVSAYDITGVVSFIAEHFRSHDDAGLGTFAASHVRLGTTSSGNLTLAADVALAPFDLGVTQEFTLTAIPSSIEGVDEVAIHVRRTSGATSDWYRANRVFMRELRTQFLLWRTLTHDLIEKYRLTTLQIIGQSAEPSAPSTTSDPDGSAPAARPAGQEDGHE